jgi:hypothetical protein
VTTVAEQSSGMVVYNSLVVQTPAEYHGAAALFVGYVRDAVINHTTVLWAADGSIELGWGWGSNVSYAGGNTIVNNHVVGSNWLLKDCGSIYVNGMQTPVPGNGGEPGSGWSEMAGNYLEDQVLLFGALYPDGEAVGGGRREGGQVDAMAQPAASATRCPGRGLVALEAARQRGAQCAGVAAHLDDLHQPHQRCVSGRAGGRVGGW